MIKDAPSEWKDDIIKMHHGRKKISLSILTDRHKILARLKKESQSSDVCKPGYLLEKEW